ncbi:hypothetical protein [Actinomadura xylanilytica]|uniref:hypothetical protein n=1 Tax=Actinomadura xylanilytica TaxID=887459 RepID=UPI00255AED4C|nr:hypothetical protein [Actinomadura xylanilytica]MDL4776397.1 hypothetical protein [Actinomadura xylanilytica]
MDSFLGLAVPALIAAVFVVVVGGNVWGALSRRRDGSHGLSAWAREHGWYYCHGTIRVPWHDLMGLSSFRVRRLLHGRSGALWADVCHCTYETRGNSGTGSGWTHSTTTVHDIVVAAAELGGGRPGMEVHRRGLGSRMARALGKRAEVESGDDEFDRRYRLESGDPDAARPFLSPELVQAHLRDEITPWRLERGTLIVVEDGVLEPAEIGRRLQNLERIAVLLGHRGGLAG